MNKRKYTSKELLTMIRGRYETRNDIVNETVVLVEVPNGTGFHQSRWIDAAVFQMWPSKGLTRSAFEIKVNRADFMNELQQPMKHQWCRDSFHEFWFVAPLEVIKEEELPAGAGFMYPRGDKLCIKRHCVRNDKPLLDDNLLAAFMRAAYKEIKAVKKRVEADCLANSPDYQEAIIYRKAVKELWEKCRLYGYSYLKDPSVEKVIEGLRSVTEAATMEEERHQLQGHLEKFQRTIASLFQVYATLASRTLLETDEMGHYVANVYGDAGDPLLYPSRSVEQKRYLNLIEFIRKWNEVTK